MKKVSPESIGLNSECIEKYIKVLNNKRLATHSIIMAKGSQYFLKNIGNLSTKTFCIGCTQ